MLDNFIRGGQLFLHNIAMFQQVLARTVIAALLVAMLLVGLAKQPRLESLDLYAATTYVKAHIMQWLADNRLNFSGNSNKLIPRIDAFDKHGLYMPEAAVKNIIKAKKFKGAYDEVFSLLYETLLLITEVTIALVLTVFIIWSRFGKLAKATKVTNDCKIFTPKEVRNYLKRNGLASNFQLAAMPLVKDQETRHMLVTGMTGSGKTNLINHLLPQIRDFKQPAIVLDSTGEMISRYYNPDRGDIIFNPQDVRGKTWDFWKDCEGEGNSEVNYRLRQFAKVLFSASHFNGRAPNDPFWENSAQTIFCCCVEYLIQYNKTSISELKEMLSITSAEELQKKLINTPAARYLGKDSKDGGSSVLAVMTTSCQPLESLTDKGEKFSLREYFADIKNGSEAWLFLSTPPSQRKVLAPLLNCVLELSVLSLMDQGANDERRVWFIIDELASLGNLPSLPILMTESRKYGGCVLSGLQSYNQLLDIYGPHMGSTIFGQFATKFIFRCNEPNLAKLMSDMFGTIEYTQQQKNTSYGAHEHRDGISYTEQQRRKPLVAMNQFMELKSLECFVALPDPEIALTRLQLLPAPKPNTLKEGFIMKNHNTSSEETD